MYFDFSKDVSEHRLYYAGKYIAKCLSYIVYRNMVVKGKENIPEEGPLIIASNHIAFSDPAVIIAHCSRTVHFMAKSELFDSRLKAALISCMNAFPVKRNYFDRSALRRAEDILSKGWVLGIFPEGRRNKEYSVSDGKKGVAYLAELSGADVLPVCIYRDKSDSSRWHKLVLRYGEVIKNAELKSADGNRKARLDYSAELIMSRIRELWEAENENYSG